MSYWSCGSPRGQEYLIQENQQVDKELLKAAITGDSTLMQAMASQDRNILLGRTPAGNTCIHISCIYGHEGFCKDVLELEESLIQVLNLDGETPLITAVRNGHVPLASFLLGQHCSVLGFRQAILQQDMYGFNALHHAIRKGHKDFALELLAADPSLSQAVGRHNESPMFFAVMRNLTPVYEKLLQNPLSACSGGQHGKNCLHAAVVSGDQEFVKIIMKKRPELAREADMLQNTPIAYAVQYDKIDILQVMLEHDSTLGYLIGHNGLPLLSAAAYRGLVAVARKLLEHCPDAPYVDPAGWTLLHTAVCFDQLEFVEFVLRTPILHKLVNLQDNYGSTALHFAVQNCNPKMVAALLSHVDIDATVLDEDGNSAAWELENVGLQNIKTLNWNEVAMLISKANPQDDPILHNIHIQAKLDMTDESRKDAKSLTQTYTNNTSFVAILIATITFAGAFTLPGGYTSDVGSEGLPIMSRKFAFQAFLISDTLAMCSSFFVAFICIIARWKDYEVMVYYLSFTKKLMWFAYVTTTTAFSTGLYTVLAPRVHWLAITICLMVALLPILTKLLSEWPVLKHRLRLSKNFKSEFLDMV